MDDDIKPYEIAVPERDLADLKVRLGRVRFPDELEAAEWDLGAPLEDVKRLAKHWQAGFDWRRAEAELKKFPQFTTDIQADGFDPVNRRPGRHPLLFIHGWPGSIYEGTKLIDPLTQSSTSTGNNHPSFHVIVPSLPNYGFSGGVSKRGFSIDQYAEVLHKLMLTLGYAQYVTQGGDWGWFISRALSAHYPQHVKATHLNLDLARQPGWLKHPLLALEHRVTPYSQHECEGFGRTSWFEKEGADTGPCSRRSRRRSAMRWRIVQHCRPAASLRIYYEFARVNRGEATRPGQMTQDQMIDWQPVPLGLSHFPKDVISLPSSWTRAGGRVVFEKTHPSGGHFPAWEKPEAIVGDLREMFAKDGPAGDVVKKNAGSKL
ncbi:alpha/beta-hydrolase [Apiospora phragmitis]|uniref:Alpha/beta-hydrolase n=1 Tax=Apiospora phragmitis TaxID=2905665 RepID=A0ABR1WA18_9PEZI